MEIYHWYTESGRPFWGDAPDPEIIEVNNYKNISNECPLTSLEKPIGFTMCIETSTYYM